MHRDRSGAGYSTTLITKHSIHTQIHAVGGTSDTMPPIIEHAKYKYLGNHLYKFKGTMFGGSHKSSCLIKWKSHQHIVVNPGWVNNSIMSYYRY